MAKPKLEDVLEQIKIICTIYESSPTKVERILQYIGEVKSKIQRSVPSMK